MVNKLTWDGALWTAVIDIRDPIGTSHRVVLRDVRIPTKPDLSNHTTNRVAFSIRNRFKKVINPEELTRMLELDFSEINGNSKPLSQKDKQFLTTMKEGIHINNGHYEMPLSLRDNMPNLPNNQEMALQRLNHLKKKL